MILFLMLLVAFYMAFVIYGLRHSHELHVMGKPQGEPVACIWRDKAPETHSPATHTERT
jgi:hypothetical protein